MDQWSELVKELYGRVILTTLPKPYTATFYTKLEEFYVIMNAVEIKELLYRKVARLSSEDFNLFSSALKLNTDCSMARGVRRALVEMHETKEGSNDDDDIRRKLARIFCAPDEQIGGLQITGTNRKRLRISISELCHQSDEDNRAAKRRSRDGLGGASSEEG